VRFSTVLFDLDHTLLDSEASEALAFNFTLRSIGVAEPGEHLPIYKRLNMALWKRVELGELSPNEVKVLRFEQLLHELQMSGDPQALGDTYVKGLGDHGELYAGSEPLLDVLYPLVTLGMVTNGIGSVQRRRIERLRLDRYFSTVAISGEVGVSKPDPAIFEHLDLDSWVPRETVLIGDSLTSDIAAGANAGISTCWFNPTGQPMTGPATPTIEVTSLDQIPDALAAL
jgi:2-haloacid dehalogenase